MRHWGLDAVCGHGVGHGSMCLVMGSSAKGWCLVCLDDNAYDVY